MRYPEWDEGWEKLRDRKNGQRDDQWMISAVGQPILLKEPENLVDRGSCMSFTAAIRFCSDDCVWLFAFGELYQVKGENLSLV